MVSAPVAIISPFEQNYWNRFGSAFIESIEALTVKPQEVILVTTARVDVPDWWKVVPYWDDRIWPCVNVGVREATAEWCTHLPVDDTMDPNFFDGLVLQGDAVNVRGRWDGGLCYGTPEQYKNLLNLQNNGMPGLAVIRRKTWLKIPYRSHKYVDWIHWCEMRSHNVEVSFDSRCVWTWVRHDDALTAQRDDQAEQEMFNFRRLSESGRVIPGEDWPPKLTE